MKFYSGFSLKNDISFFSNYINSSAYSVAGFSYGAIKAFEYTLAELNKGNRVDTIQLFSPAFFQTKSEKFKKMQLLGFKRDKESYLSKFLDSCFSPYQKKDLELCEARYEELLELLNYEWSLSQLKELESRGVKIEVYLGEKDLVIDLLSAKELFIQVGTLTYIKNANHFLQIN